MPSPASVRVSIGLGLVGPRVSVRFSLWLVGIVLVLGRMSPLDVKSQAVYVFVVVMASE